MKTAVTGRVLSHNQNSRFLSQITRNHCTVQYMVKQILHLRGLVKCDSNDYIRSSHWLKKWYKACIVCHSKPDSHSHSFLSLIKN